MKSALYIVLAAVLSISASGQVLKTNAVWDASATLNLGAEFRTGGRTSVDLPVSYNPWEWDGNRKWKHALVQPSLRIWTNEAFGGHFFGVHGHWAYYNIGRPPLSDYMRAHHFEGRLYGGGVSWGYRWNFGRGGRRHTKGTYTEVDTDENQKRTRPYEVRTAGWGLEFEVGVGYAWLDYDIYKCGKCGDFVAHETKHWVGPTKVALNLVYAWGGVSGNPQGVLTRRERVLTAPDRPIRRAVRSQPVAGGSHGLPPHPFTPTFIVPDPEGYKERTDSLRADVEFVFDVAELDPRYRDNASQLRRLNVALGDIRRSRHSSITAVNIIGFASPEGAESYNTTLSVRRAMSVKDYLEASTGLPHELFAARGEGERPDGLRAMVEVDYTVEPLSLDEIKRAIRARPQLLSIEEMFRLSCTYNPESDDYREVFEIAATTFPYDDVANINAAAANLLHGNIDAAAFYLERCRHQPPAWWDNTGIVFYLRGDLARAAVSFSNAGTTGFENAAALERLLATDNQ